jgi:hypothetical protein
MRDSLFAAERVFVMTSRAWQAAAVSGHDELHPPGLIGSPAGDIVARVRGPTGAVHDLTVDWKWRLIGEVVSWLPSLPKGPTRCGKALSPTPGPNKTRPARRTPSTPHAQMQAPGDRANA